MPGQFIRDGSTSFFWLFTAAGAFSPLATIGPEIFERPFEYVAAVIVLAVVRLLTAGIRLTP
jgi:hypothetical protein